jgi:hypothetical protein
MPHALTACCAWVIAAVVASGCAHRLPATASEPLEVTSAAESPSDEPALEVEVKPGGLVAHLMFADDDGRRRVRVHHAGDGRIEIRLLSRRKYIAPWSKCARPFARRTIDLDVRGLAPGRYRVELTHNGVPAEPREISVATADNGPALPTASMRSGERGC